MQAGEQGEAPAVTAQGLFPPPLTLASRTELVGAPPRSKTHTKVRTESKTQWRSEEKEEKQRKRTVMRRALLLTLFTKKEKAREVDKGAWCWTGFYTAQNCP